MFNIWIKSKTISLYTDKIVNPCLYLFILVLNSIPIRNVPITNLYAFLFGTCQQYTALPVKKNDRHTWFVHWILFNFGKLVSCITIQRLVLRKHIHDMLLRFECKALISFCDNDFLKINRQIRSATSARVITL